MRKWMTELTIRKKLVGMTTLISGFALLFAGFVLVMAEYFREKEAMVENLSVQMRLVAHSCRIALRYNDPESAQDILDALEASEGVISAAILTKAMRPFVVYVRRGHEQAQENWSNWMTQPSPLFVNDSLVLHEPILFEKEVVGHIVVRTGLEDLHKDTIEDITYIFLVVVPTILIVFMLSSRLYRVITRPIDVLRKAAIDIGESKFAGPIAVHSRDEIGELTTAFNKMSADLDEQRRALEWATRAKSEFLANMSHEIRTPMNAVIGLTDLAMQGDHAPKTQDYLRKIGRAARSLLRLINDILDFSKIEAGKLDLEESRFMLRDVFARVADLFRSRASEQGLELILCVAEECRYELTGDSLRLEQILVNLVSNAIKFTKVGEVEIQARTLEESPSETLLQFSVRDTGIGMTDEEAAKVFAPFTQADSSTTRKHGGTGLGLSICQRLVAMMGGRIWLTSAPGQGSTFFFSARFKRRPGVEAEEIPIPEAVEQLRVLVVDDHSAARNAVLKSLEAFGFQATGVASAPEALATINGATAAGTPFQLVMVDWSLPASGGMTTAQGIRAQSGQESIKMILMVPANRESEARAAAAADVAAFLVKPANCSLLFDTIMEVFGHNAVRLLREERRALDLAGIGGRIGGARVLLVEDNAVNRQVAEEVLVAVGIVVDKAETGLEAIIKVGSTPYDAVLMDIQMPEMDGFQATQVMRRDPGLQGLPIIAMTAHAMAGDRERCLQAGMNDHLAKPIDRHLLYTTLVRWIRPRPGLGRDLSPAAESVETDDAGDLPEILPGIDLTAALAQVGGKKKLLESLLREFCADCARAATTVGPLLQERSETSLIDAGRIVHTIRGMAGNLAAVEVSAAACALEEGLRAAAPEQWPPLLTTFNDALAKVMAGIAALPSPPSATSTEGNQVNVTLDPGQVSTMILPVLRTLDQCLAKRDIKALTVFEPLQALSAGLPVTVRDRVAELERHLDRLEFKKGREVLHGVADLLQLNLKE
ncbi:MAG: response regulator [Magnetococcales bacterium]|nr:response regulator [Magnetococcales bacterium]